MIDAKHKPLTDARFPNADAYQMLACCTALQLDRGFLIYAKDAVAQRRDHTITHAGKTIHVRAIDLEREPRDILHGVEELAAEIARVPHAAAA